YHPGVEWITGIVHSEESTRGQADRGDAYSPGWFELPLSRDASAVIVLAADPDMPSSEAVSRSAQPSRPATPETGFETQLRSALSQFVVRRGDLKTVIAGYPWFLDWGRDTLIAVRGLVAAG